MTYDQTEGIRKIHAQLINAGYSEDRAKRKLELIQSYGEDNVWDNDEVSEIFSFQGFMMPYAVVTRYSDGQRGTVTFTHSPRFYFDFKPE